MLSLKMITLFYEAIFRDGLKQYQNKTRLNEIYFNFLAIPLPTASGWQAGAVVQGRRSENLKITTKGNNNNTQN